MALSFDAASSAVTAGAVSKTWAHTCSGENRLLVVGVSLRAATTVTGITYNGVALTQLTTMDASWGSGLDIWYLIAPASGANNIVVTLAAGARSVLGAASFNGAHQTTPLGTPATETSGSGGSATDPSLAVSSAVGEIVFDVVCDRWGSGQTMTVGAGQTQRWNAEDQNGSIGAIGGGSTEPGAASVTMSWDLSAATNHWNHAVVAVLPTAGQFPGSLGLLGVGV